MHLCWELSTFSIIVFSEYAQVMTKPGSGAAKDEIRRITMLLYCKALKDTDTAGLLHEKFEAHCKLIRYEPRVIDPIVGPRYKCFPVHLRGPPFHRPIVHPIRRLVSQRLILSLCIVKFKVVT